MLRSLLLKTAAAAKADGATDMLVRYHPLIRRRLLHRMEEFHAPAADVSALSDALTARVLNAAQLTSYGAGRTCRLSDWPVLDKETLRTTPKFINPRSLIRIPAGTGGTNGVPLKLWRSLESVVAEQAFLDSILAPYGLSMRSRVAVLRADTVKPPGYAAPPYGRISHGGRRLTLSSPHLSPQTLRWYYDSLRDFAPSVLWVYPSMATNLLRLLGQADLPLRIPVILASSEMLLGSAHRALEAWFQCRVINYYGQAERVCLAYSTKPEEFYFSPGYGRVELNASPPGNSEGDHYVRIIGTGYWNLAMPLIRYHTGDYLYVPKEYGEKELADIAIGRRPFTSMAGREGEYILTRDGMRIIGLNQIPREIEHISQIQLVQPDFDTLQVNVIALPGFSAADAAALRDQARAKLPSSIQVAVQPVERLLTTARGKTPFVIRHV